MQNTLPFCTMDEFVKQLAGTPTPTATATLPTNSTVPAQQQSSIIPIKKSTVLAFVSDSSGCGHIRCIFPLTYLNATSFSRDDIIRPTIVPFYVFQEDILLRTRSMFFQRQMSREHLPSVVRYRELAKRLGFRMIYDIDDFIWKGPDEGECVPKYNPASETVGEEARTTSIEMMNLMDLVTVSSDFLAQYLKNQQGVRPPIKVIPNAVPMYFWDTRPRKRPITTRIKKPRIVYTGSPTHYCNGRKLLGDWENAWREWVIKSVRQQKIEFLCMGGTPWFFESIKSQIRVFGWLNSYQYHLPMLKFAPDFGIAPLVPNYFNYSKSYIKYQEYCAAGAVGVGTTFTNGKPSPYDICVNKAPDNITVEQIDEMFDRLCEPEAYNASLQAQYKQLDENGWWLESPKYVNTLASIF